jgi:hypothetical protein
LQIKEVDVSVFKRGGIYHSEFVFEGQRHRGSTRLTNRNAAMHVESMRIAALAAIEKLEQFNAEQAIALAEKG